MHNRLVYDLHRLNRANKRLSVRNLTRMLLVQQPPTAPVSPMYLMPRGELVIPSECVRKGYKEPIRIRGTAFRFSIGRRHPIVYATEKK